MSSDTAKMYGLHVKGNAPDIVFVSFFFPDFLSREKSNHAIRKKKKIATYNSYNFQNSLLFTKVFLDGLENGKNYFQDATGF